MVSTAKAPATMRKARIRFDPGFTIYLNLSALLLIIRNYSSRMRRSGSTSQQFEIVTDSRPVVEGPQRPLSASRRSAARAHNVQRPLVRETCARCMAHARKRIRHVIMMRKAGYRQPRCFVAQAFCADCGTPIYAAAAENPTQYNLRLGAVAQRAEIPALRQGWCRSALSWAQNVARLPESPQP